MDSIENNIKRQNELQKSVVESLTGQNEVQDIIETLIKAGVPEDQFIEKAKYIRREGSKGNYKYIYEEPKNRGGVEREYTFQYKNRFGEVHQKSFVATSEEEALKMAKERISGTDIEPSKVPDKTGRQEKDSEQQSQKKEDKNQKLNDIIREEVGDEYSNSQINSILEQLDEAGLEDRDFKVRGAKSQSHEMDLVNKKVNELMNDLRPGMEHKDLDKSGIRDILYGLVRAKSFYTLKSADSDLLKSHTEEQKAKIKKVMDEWKAGKLKDKGGNVISDQKQAIAVALSEAGVNKSELIDLIKAGEGSRGGKIIGHTKSGKPIYEGSEHHKIMQSHSNFSSEMHRAKAEGIRRNIVKMKREDKGKSSGDKTTIRQKELERKAKIHEDLAHIKK